MRLGIVAPLFAFAMVVCSQASSGAPRCMTLRPDPDAFKARIQAASSIPGKTKASVNKETLLNVIDVLVAYDRSASEWRNRNKMVTAENYAKLQIGRMNECLENSGLSDDFCFRLAGTIEIAIDASSMSISDTVKCLVDEYGNAATDGEFAKVCQKRKACGADIVTVLVSYGKTGVVGLGYSLEGGDYAEDLADIKYFSDWAYNVCSIESVDEDLTMIHEIGHNMGCGHADISCAAPTEFSGMQLGPQLFPYSAGYYFWSGGTGYTTIMGYNFGGLSEDGMYDDSVRFTVIPYFSSPNLSYKGSVIGTAGANDNVRTLRETYRYVAQYMVSTVPEESPSPELPSVFPLWAKGTFSGEVKNWCYEYDDPDDAGPWYGTATLTISSDGKVSGAIEFPPDLKGVPGKLFSVTEVSDNKVKIEAEFKWVEDGDVIDISTSEIVISLAGGKPVLHYLDGDGDGVDYEVCPVEGMLDKVPDVTEPFITNATVFNGYVLGDDGSVAGTIQIKAGKPNKKTGLSKLTASVTMLGEKKVTIKGETVDGSATMTAKDGRVLTVNLAANVMTGSFDGMNIVLFRDLFSSKDKTEKVEAEATLEPWLGALNMVCDGGVFTVTVAKKGKVTVKGTLDGAKVSAKATALIGEDAICIPVAYSKKGVELAFTLWLPFDGGAIEIVGLDGAIVGKAGTLKAGAKFSVDGDLAADIPGAQTSATDEIGVSYSLLPDGVSVSVDGRKWPVADGAKAAKVKYDKKTGKVTVTPGKKGQVITNASGLKLTYKAKDGSFKGSFYVYTLIDGRFKKQKANITGVLIDGIGYGTATIKKIGSWSVVIE